MHTTVEMGSRQRAGYEAEDSSAGGVQAPADNQRDNRGTVSQEALRPRQLASMGLVIYHHAEDISDSPTLRAARLALSSRRAGVEPIKIGQALLEDSKLIAQGAHRPRRWVDSATQPEGAYWTRAAKEEARVLREERFQRVVEAEFGQAQRMQGVSIDSLADFIDRHRPRTIGRRDTGPSEQELEREVAAMISSAHTALDEKKTTDVEREEQEPAQPAKTATVSAARVVFTPTPIEDLVPA